MALKIRLRRQGRTNRPFYRLIVADTRSPRDGKYIETIGWYNPVQSDENQILSVEIDRVQHWLDLGAEPSEKAEALVAQGAPEVMKAWKEKRQARHSKLVAKKKDRRRAKAA